ncbi:MAG: hypothetical protein RSA70_05850, partial [Clostridia bacterium]
FIGITRDECKGKKCYEILMHNTAPCEFCSMAKMTKDKLYTRLFNIPNTPQILLMRGKNINRNGDMVHIEVAVDVTEVENVNPAWKEDIGHGK